MLSLLNPASQSFINNLDRVSQRLSQEQQQISSGLRVANVSDDPDSVSEILQVRAHLSSNQQVLQNLGRVTTETTSADQALQSATTLMDKTRTLAAQAASGTQTADTQKDLAQQVGAILEQLVGLANTTVEGRYVFGGDSDQTAPYSVDLTQTAPVSSYQGSATTREVQHPDGTTFRVAETAQQIFDAPAANQNVFSSVLGLYTALQTNDTAGIDTAIQNVTGAGTYLNTQLAFYGSVENKITDATNFGNSLQLQLQTQISQLQDADSAQVIVQMTQDQTAQQAAIQSWAQIPRTTLFDFLK
ncbi:MAG: flagellin [Bryobacteraceae bacterium]